MMHVTAFIRSLRSQVKKLGRGVKGADRRGSLQKVISLGILSERVWAILYRDSFSEPVRAIHSFTGDVNAHAIRRVSGANLLMEMAMADEEYAISARTLRELLAPPAVSKLSQFTPMTADELASAKRIGLSLYVEMSKAARHLGSSRVAAAIDEISRGERRALGQLLQNHVLVGGFRCVV